MHIPAIEISIWAGSAGVLDSTYVYQGKIVEGLKVVYLLS